MVLDSLQMPLVDKHNDSLAFRFVDRAEKFVVFFVNENVFEAREENVHTRDVPVHHVVV